MTTALHAEDYEARTYESSDGHTLKYRIHIPEDLDPEERYPLILFLHGAGERGDDNMVQLTHGAFTILSYTQETDNPAIIVAPQCPAEMRWVNTRYDARSHTMPELPTLPMRLAMELLEEIVATQPVDDDRIYVTGLSMGGFAVWDILQRQPERFAAAIPICGGGDPTYAERIRDVPTWVFHGTLDTTIVPQRSREMVDAIRRAGGRPSYTEYGDLGHDAWTRTYDSEMVLEWLFDQSR